MKDVEITLMEIETRLDRLQNYLRKNDYVRSYREALKCLGAVRRCLEYTKPHPQKTLRHFGFGETWRHSVRAARERIERESAQHSEKDTHPYAATGNP